MYEAKEEFPEGRAEECEFIPKHLQFPWEMFELTSLETVIFIVIICNSSFYFFFRIGTLSIGLTNSTLNTIL